jgi:transketolase
MAELKEMEPSRFVQVGIMEHHAAALAGGLSAAGAIPFFADFAVFAVGETYNQQRLNDINGTSVKLVATHCGLDVGEDGKTHQCVDYLGLLASQFGWKVVMPADANQTDRVVRWMATTPGNLAVAVGRSKLRVLEDEEGKAAFAGGYEFVYGRGDWLRRGGDGTLVTAGTMVARALEARERLREQGWEFGVLALPCPLELDEEAMREAAGTGVVVCYEDHNVRSGLGSLVARHLMEAGLNCRFRALGATRWGKSGPPEELYEEQGLGVEHLVAAAVELKEGK